MVSKGALVRRFFVKKSFCSENLRNQGENLEKFKERPCKAKKPEKMGNIRNSPLLEKNHRFLYSDTECSARSRPPPVSLGITHKCIRNS